MYKKKYYYDGPIMSFEKIITDRWKAETYAVSESKAMSNFKYQAKMKLGKVINSRISLPGKIMEVQDNGKQLQTQFSFI